MRVHSNSGAGPNQKCDVSDSEFIGECKTTHNQEQITLKRQDLLKLLLHSSRSGKLPFLTLSFEGDDKKWVIVLDDDFKSLMIQAKGNR